MSQENNYNYFSVRINVDHVQEFVVIKELIENDRDSIFSLVKVKEE